MTSRFRTGALALGVIALVAAGAALVWSAGGTKTVFPHLLYLPVVLAALLWGWRGALPIAIVSGVAIGPLMPLDVATGTSQPTVGWLIRMGFYLAVGLLVAEGQRRLLRLAESRQRFVSAISHELRTPLAAVVGFSHLLAERYFEYGPKEHQEFAELIHREINALSDIVDGYIIAARLDDSALIIDPSFVDLNIAAREVVERLPAAVSRSRVMVREGAANCWADPLRLRQIIRAVLTNLLVYGGQRIEIETTTLEGMAVLTVNDRDSAIPREFVDTALTPLQPGEAGDTRTRPIGMGLAVPARLAQLMGGSLEYRRQGADTVLRIALPTHPASTRARQPARSPWSVTSPRL